MHRGKMPTGALLQGLNRALRNWLRGGLGEGNRRRHRACVDVERKRRGCAHHGGEDEGGQGRFHEDLRI